MCVPILKAILYGKNRVRRKNKFQIKEEKGACQRGLSPVAPTRGLDEQDPFNINNLVGSDLLTTVSGRLRFGWSSKNSRGSRFLNDDNCGNYRSKVSQSIKDPGGYITVLLLDCSH